MPQMKTIQFPGSDDVYEVVDEGARESIKTQQEKINDKLDADKLSDAVNDALAKAKADGEFKGEPGDPGADGNGVASIDIVSIDSEEDEEGGNSQSDYYIPSVSTDGILSWIASNDNMPAVPPVNIKGPQGNSGRTPVKGVDYFTDAEKADLVAEVLAALPVYEGEVADA